LPDVGQSLRGIMDEHMPEFFKVGIPGGYFPAVAPEMASACFNDITDQAEILRYGAAMTGHSSDTYSGKVTYAAWRDIPGTTIIPQSDMIVAVQEQEKMYQHAVANGGKIKRIPVEGGAHGITVSQPQLVADELIKLAKA
jgi:hypothetical protein